jgi:hypothetical protein
MSVEYLNQPLILGHSVCLKVLTLKFDGTV